VWNFGTCRSETIKLPIEEIFNKIESQIKNGNLTHFIEKLKMPESRLFAFLIANDGQVKLNISC